MTIARSIRSLLFASLYLSPDNVQAFPNGAGGCQGRGPAVMGPHIAGGVGSMGPLAEGNFALMIDDIVIPDGALVTLQLEGEYEITVMLRGEGEPFKGVLIRGEDVSGNQFGTLNLDPREGDMLLKVADVCAAPALGLTHQNPDPKTVVTGLIQYTTDADAPVTEVSGAILDVTVVVETQVFYHSTYTMNFVENLATPTDSPVEGVPPAEPISEPTTAPITPAPTKFPTASPVELPAASCLYNVCAIDADCCVEAPICRNRAVAGGVKRICSARPRVPKTKLCGTCGGGAARPSKGV